MHNWSGFWPVIRVSESILFPTYFLISSLAFCICLVWLVRRAEARRLQRNTALDLSLFVMVAGFVGARAFHILFEEPRYYWESPARVWEFWRGGFVWYGGALAAAAAALIFIKRKRLELGTWLDLLAPVGALGYAIGRIACWSTGCCFGDVCTLPSGFSFRYPTQLFAVFWELSVVVLLLWLERLRLAPRVPMWLRTSGRIFIVWMLAHSIGRVIMESFRGDPRGPALLGLSISTWISLGLIVASLVLLKRKPAQARS